ncbi:MAG: DUF366 family protein [Cytophagia bacterium]|jgi:hypothetical protein|nr:DUF366 family protein [Cytophagia bacterium]NBW33575.1 DUF366 family protein [Cytophagia bacterium]
MIITDQKIYDGSFIHKRFAYKYFRDKTLAIGNIVSFVAPVEVTLNLIDLEDSLEKDYIYSDSMVNFCWEIPNLDPFGAVCFQRLYNTNIANILHNIIKKPIVMKGDDIMVHAEHSQGGIVQTKGKASVSITYSKDNVAIGHTGINITAGKRAPAFAYSTNLTPEQVQQFQTEAINLYYSMVDNIFVATSKVIV